MKINNNGITSLIRTNCSYKTEFIRSGKSLGKVNARYRVNSGAWQVAENQDSEGESTEAQSFTRSNSFAETLSITTKIVEFGDGLKWDILVTNTGAAELEIGDLALPLEMNADYTKDVQEKCCNNTDFNLAGRSTVRFEAW